MRQGLIIALASAWCVLPFMVCAEESAVENKEVVEVPLITVIGQPVERQGTGQLNLDSPSTSQAV